LLLINPFMGCRGYTLLRKVNFSDAAPNFEHTLLAWGLFEKFLCVLISSGFIIAFFSI